MSLPTNIDSRPVIFHLLTGFGIGGAERLIERLMPEVKDFRHVVISLKGDGPIRPDLEKAGLETEIVNMRTPVSPRAFLVFRRLVKKYQPAILSTCLVHADLIGRVWGKLCGIPKNTCYLVARYRDRRYWLVVRLMRWTDWLVDGYIAVSAEVERYFIEDVHLPARKFTIIVNSVDAEKFTAGSSDTRISVLNELKLPTDAAIVGTVSNLRQEKCVDRLVAGLAVAFKTDKSAYGIIVGRGVYKASLEEQADKLGIADRLRFVGFWPEIKQMLSVIDIFVLPSMFEGMSIALLEAMAARRAIIVTDTPENREVITAGTGLLVNTADPQELGQALTGLIQNPDKRHQLGEAARQRVIEHFSLNRSVKEMSDFYHKYI